MPYAILDRATRTAGLAMLAAIMMLALTSLPARAAGSSGSTSGGAGLGTQQTTAKPPAATSGRKSTTRKGGDSRHLGDRVLHPGMRGHDVRVLQDYLTLAGYPTTIDGSFGSTTERNVIAFETAQGLTANGIVTIPDEKALRAVVAQIEANPPTGKTRINADGTATAPAGASSLVLAMVAAANQIIHTSYCYAGGHGSWKSSCYDCSGTVSYVLHGAGLLSAPEDSTQLETYGSPGPGKWVTIYADPSHTWIVVAGRAFDTAGFSGPNIPAGSGPRWRSNPIANLQDGGSYIIRHPAGL